jgi:hypothetical protein
MGSRPARVRCGYLKFRANSLIPEPASGRLPILLITGYADPGDLPDGASRLTAIS